MSGLKYIKTDNAPAAIGTYSQAVLAGDFLYVSGQIPLLPSTMTLISPDIEQQVEQCFKNLAAVIAAAEAELNNTVKITIYLTDLGHFDIVNSVMATYFTSVFPARAAIEISGLPRGSLIEMDAVVYVPR